MKNLIKGVFVFGIFVFQSSTVFATGYNYLPADVLLKQQEEKSALEYRLQNLEAGISGNSLSYVLSLSSRISQLESERTAEKNYISGTYGRYGIGNQLPAKLAEIDSKYDAQISALQSQKASYQNELTTQQSTEKEISDLKLQIAQLKAQIVDQELQANLDALEKYKNPTPVEYSDAYVYDFFLYLDSLSLRDASDFFQRVLKNNPDVAKKVSALYDQKYPNGKPGTAKNIEYLKSTQKPLEPETVKPQVLKKEPKVVQTIEPKKAVEVLENKKEIPPQQVATTSVVVEKIVEIAHEEEKETIGKKIRNFFSKWFKGNR